MGSSLNKCKNISMKKFKKRSTFGGNTGLQRVSFVGWWVVGGGWCTFFRPHSGTELSIYPSYARTSLAPLGIIKMKEFKDI